ICHHRDVDAGRYGRLQARQCSLYAIDNFDDVGARLPKDGELHAAAAVCPARNPGILRSVDRRADVSNTDGRAVSEADDDIVVLVGALNLIVVVDREALRGAVEGAFRTVDGRVGQDRSNFFKAKPERGELCRIDLDANSGLLLAEDYDLGHPADL